MAANTFEQGQDISLEALGDQNFSVEKKATIYPESEFIILYHCVRKGSEYSTDLITINGSQFSKLAEALGYKKAE